MTREKEVGVGRGNGAGSARTQFKNGMPSANPHGRPKKPKVLPPETIGEAISRALVRPVEMRNGTRDKTVPLHDAMIETLLNDFVRATPSVKLGIMKFCSNVSPVLRSGKPDVNSEVFEKLIEFIIAQAGDNNTT